MQFEYYLSQSTIVNGIQLIRRNFERFIMQDNLKRLLERYMQLQILSLSHTCLKI